MTMPSAEDLRQIQNLLFDYGSTLDGGRWDEHLSLWIEDCEMFVFGRSFRGREAIDRFMRKAVRGKHVTAVPHLEFDEDRARCRADFVFYRSSDMQLYSAGFYRDDLVRIGEEWKLARREIEIQLREES
jgi:3-phenylpropionate/cinnamic acid dioxygenase small subunit